MRVAIEIAHMRAGPTGGMAVMLRHLLPRLFALGKDHQFTVYCTEAARGLIEERFPNVRIVTFPVWAFYPRLDDALEREQPEVLLRRFPFDDRIDFPAHRHVVILPDLQHETLPHLFESADLERRRAGFGRAMAQAGGLVTLSEYARHTIEEHPDYGGSPVTVCYPALPPLVRPVAVSVPKPYVFFPANLWPHKNHERLLPAFHAFNVQHGNRFELVLSGHPNGWEALRARHPDVKVRHLGFVDDATLAGLFAEAHAVLFFSLYEGFGIPLLEAFHWGAPVACSDRCSLPEVAGSAAVLCDPEDEAKVAAAIESVCMDDALRARLRTAGRERLGHFKWDGCAQALLGALEATATRPPPAAMHPWSPQPVSDGAASQKSSQGLVARAWYAVRPLVGNAERLRLRVIRRLRRS